MKVTYKGEGVGIFDEMVNVIDDDGKKILGQRKSYKRGVMFHKTAFPTGEEVTVDQHSAMGQKLIKNASNEGSPFSVKGVRKDASDTEVEVETEAAPKKAPAKKASAKKVEETEDTPSEEAEEPPTPETEKDGETDETPDAPETAKKGSSKK